MDSDDNDDNAQSGSETMDSDDNAQSGSETMDSDDNDDNAQSGNMSGKGNLRIEELLKLGKVETDLQYGGRVSNPSKGTTEETCPTLRTDENGLQLAHDMLADEMDEECSSASAFVIAPKKSS